MAQNFSGDTPTEPATDHNAKPAATDTKEFVPDIAATTASSSTSTVGATQTVNAQTVARERLIYLVAGIAAVLIVFYFLQYATTTICCGDYDGFYHIKWSEQLWRGLRAGSFPPSFEWLPHTTLNPKDYVDHHFLFHILQMPFIWFLDLRTGAKLSAFFYGSLAVISCYWMIWRYQLRYPFLWLVALFASSTAFLYRINMTKAPALSIVFMIAGIYLLFRRKYIWLAPLMFLYVWTYSLWVLLGAATVIWAGVIFWSERKLEWKPVAYATVGAIAGLVINPYFPADIVLFYRHAMMKLGASEFATSVGQEWYPYSSWDFLMNCTVACVAMVLGYIFFDWTNRKRAQAPAFFLIFSTILLIATMAQRRWVEYFPPFAILFVAFSLQQIFDRSRHQVAQLPDEILSDLKSFLDRDEGEPETFVATERPRTTKSNFEWAMVVIAGAALAGIAFVSIGRARNDIIGSPAYEPYEAGMRWINKNVPKGEIIFNTDWDDFPKMFYFDTDHRYVSGLDPEYLLKQNPELSNLYVDITTGKLKDFHSIIKDKFGARYVFTDNDEGHDDFVYNALSSGWFENAYEDDHCTVLKLRDQKGAPDLNNESSGDDNNTADDETNAAPDAAPAPNSNNGALPTVNNITNK